MQAPRAACSPEYHERPMWWEGLDPTEPGDEHTLPRTADAVVVGGGYTGLSAARELARHGRAVVLVERETLGWGASSRNGGMVHPGLRHDLPELLARFGPVGAELYAETFAAFARVERLIEEEAIDCSYVRSGHLRLAHDRHQARRMKVGALAARERGEDVRFLERDELGVEVGTSEYHAGTLVELSGGLHPARYAAGLAAAADAAGADLHERTPARAIERSGPGRWKVVTARGTVETAHVLVATNGYTDELVPWLRRRVIPIGSYIIATEPLPAAVARAVSPGRRMMFDSRNFLCYWRLGPDDRMVFGGRASFRPTTVAHARDRLYRAMVRIHPQLKGTRVEFAWGGQVGFTRDRMPHLGRVDGITYALGYCGTGIALSTHFGALAADWICGGPVPPFAALGFPVVPMYRGRPWFLRPAGMYFRARDMLG